MVLAKLESPALIADIMLVVGQAVLTVTDEVMITEEPFFRRPRSFPGGPQRATDPLDEATSRPA